MIGAWGPVRGNAEFQMRFVLTCGGPARANPSAVGRNGR